MEYSKSEGTLREVKRHTAYAESCLSSAGMLGLVAAADIGGKVLETGSIVAAGALGVVALAETGVAISLGRQTEGFFSIPSRSDNG